MESQVERRAGKREVHSSSASSLLIIKYIILFVTCTAHENMFTHYKVYNTSGSVHQNNIFFGCMYSPHSHIIRFMPQVAVYSRSKREAGEGILMI